MREIEEQRRFLIVEHSDRIVEVVYPAEPDNGAVTDYTFRIKRIIDAQGGPWMCLVDQSALRAMAPRLADKIRLLNRYAMRKQMWCSARVVAPTAPSVQAAFLAGDPGLHKMVRAFRSRTEAFSWLRATAAGMAAELDESLPAAVPVAIPPAEERSRRLA